MVQRSHNGWFLSSIEYSGQEGHAEFFRPQAWIEGDIKIKFHELNSPRVILEDSQEEFHLDYCRNIYLRTSYGEFATKENVYPEKHPPFEDYCSFTGSQSWIRHRFLQPQYKTFNNKDIKYWVLPISNYLSYFHTHYPSELKDHPLRINNPKGLTHFLFNGSLGFIEPLIDYEERKRILLVEEKRSLITAIMVGEARSPSPELHDLEQWFPFYFLNLLGLATGREIGSPWIELRDAYGQLIERVHISLGNPSFQNGHNIIDEEMYRGSTGRLLTQSQVSLHRGASYLNPILRHLVRSCLYELPFEESLDNIFQALDCLCEVYNLSTQNLTHDIDPGLVVQVKNILKSAAGKIRTIGSACSDIEKDKLERIAQKTVNSANMDRAFGLSLVDLLRLFSMPDANIMDAYFSSNQSSGTPATWSSYISHFRGTAIHVGYFDLNHEPCDMEKVIDTKVHLTDILIRIVLKMLCYDWFYRTPLWIHHRKSSTYQNVTVLTEWFDHQEVQASNLGYEQRFNSPNEDPSWRALMEAFVSDWENKRI